MENHATQSINHPILSAHEEQWLARKIEDARQAVAAALGAYLPAINTLLQRYRECRAGTACLEDYLLGLQSGELPNDTAAWILRLEQLRTGMEICKPHWNDRKTRAQVQRLRRIWSSLRLHPCFLNRLVEDFIAEVEQRTELESRFARICRKTGYRRPASMRALQQLADSHHDARPVARRLLQAITTSGLSNRQLRQVQRRVVLALTGLHREKARLIIVNQRLVNSIARPFARAGMPLQDLIQEGNLGLLRAVDGFDFRRGCKFSTYAVWWIRRAVVRAVVEQTGPMHIPFHQICSLRKVERTQAYLTQQLGRRPDLLELASQSGMNSNDIRQLLQLPCTAVSLDTLAHPIGVAPMDTLADPGHSEPGETVDRNGICNGVEQTLHSLPAMQAQVIRMRYGIGLHQEYTLAHIGRQFGLSRERIRQIEADALASLRELAGKLQL